MTLARGTLAFLLFVGLFVLSGAAQALDSVYTVSGVTVDVTAQTATAARSHGCSTRLTRYRHVSPVPRDNVVTG